FARGVALLEQGAARAEVLAQWTDTLKAFGRSRYRDQLRDLVAELTKQVGEDRRLAATRVKDPAKLPPRERPAYYLAPFPHRHGRGPRASRPGHRTTLGMGAGTAWGAAGVRTGRHADPALIDHLPARPVTRSIGFRRDFEPHRVVLRVQDVAVQCIEEILQV